MSYALLRNFLFRLEPETAHEWTLRSLRLTKPLGIPRLMTGAVPDFPHNVMGLRFPNPVGLAAGLDKNGDYMGALGALGFGFIEVGTVTPRPQMGNPRPRMFRLPQATALINRMGFNNKGVDHLVRRLADSGYDGVIGVNIGKNADTPVERAVEDYLICLEKVYPYADYITINVSSPNTAGLRDLQHGGMLDGLLGALTVERTRLSLAWDRYVPLVIKIAPDLDDAQLDVLADTLLRHGLDAVAATNTTLSRDGVTGQPYAEETGGLSGAPLLARSNAVIARLSERLQGAIPIIGIGGIMAGADAVSKLHAGASLVQIYTGLIYRGPALIRESVQAMRSMNAETVAD